MATEKRLIEYYVIKNINTGCYFRGKGANRWGKYHNQASVYRMKAHAENTLGWLLQHGEPVEIVPIQIVENPTDIVEVVRCKDCVHYRHGTSCVCDLHSEESDQYSRGFDVQMLPNDFCPYGERKDND